MDLIQKNKKELILLVVTLFLIFLMLEFVVRLYWYPPQDKGYPKELHILNEELGYSLQPGYEGNFPMERYSHKKIKVNSNGLRDDDIPYERENDNLRILVLGDSVTFGSGVNEDEIYTSYLETKLRSAGISADVINAGVSGYEFNQEKQFYDTEGYKYDPDYVFIAIVLNDIYDADIPQIKENMRAFGYHDRPADTGVEKVIKQVCRSCVLLYNFFYNYNDKYFMQIYSQWDDDVAFARYEERLTELQENLSSQDKELVLIIFPYTQQFENWKDAGTHPQERIKTLAAKQDIAVIDLLPYLDRVDYPSLYLYGDNLHLNEEGNKVAAEGIYIESVKQELFA